MEKNNIDFSRYDIISDIGGFRSFKLLIGCSYDDLIFSLRCRIRWLVLYDRRINEKKIIKQLIDSKQDSNILLAAEICLNILKNEDTIFK